MAFFKRNEEVGRTVLF